MMGVVLPVAACDGDPAASDSGTTDLGGNVLVPIGGSCEDSGDPFDAPFDEEDGGDDTGGGEDTGDPVGDDIPIASAYQIRDTTVPAGRRVRVSGLVVIGPAARLDDGWSVVFAQAIEGGDNSGLPLRIAPGVQAPDAAVGDVVSVTGTVSQRYGLRALDLDVGAEAYVVESSGAVPRVHDVTERGLVADPARALALEGTLVRIEQAEVEDRGKCGGEIELVDGVRIDDLYLSLPSSAVGVLAAVTGPLRYTYNGFAVTPRTLVDLEP
jgi:hypothetical protein